MIIQEIILPFDAILPKAKILRSGAITCMYENGNIRYIKLGELEILSSIYGALADKNWCKIPCHITEEKLTRTEDGFTINYTATYLQDDISYRVEYTIEAKAGNSIIFTMNGIANANFKANCIGICVHHPIKECKEKTVIITKPDGMFYRSLFPKFISSDPIFKEIKKMQWETENSLAIHLLFEGAIFETADQRNWSDSSYKTYSSPLTLPATANISIGDRLHQSVSVRLSGITNIPTTTEDKIKKRKIPFPAIGYSRQNNQPKLTPAEIELLVKIPFDQYRMSVFVAEKYWTHELQTGIAEAEQLNTKVQLAIYFSSDILETVNKVIYYLKDKQSLVQSILIFQQNIHLTPTALLQQVYPIFKNALPDIKIGYGAAFSFADLNKSKPIDLPFDFINFAYNPQEDAIDDRSFIESIQNQQDMMDTLKEFAQGKDIHIGPVKLSSYNFEIAQYKEEEINKTSQTGLNKQTWLTAWWTLLTIQNCGSAKSISFFELFGAQGLLQIKPESNAEAATIIKSPIYDMLVIIKKFKPVSLIKRYLNDSLIMDGLLLENKKQERLFFKVPDEIINFKKV